MNRLKLIWLFSLALLISCEDSNKNEVIQSEFILVGVASDKIDMQIYSPDLRISFENVSDGGIPSTGFSGDLSLDLDSDISNDIKFNAYYGYGCSVGGCTTKACKISNIDNKEIEIFLNPLNLNDTIDNNLDWSILGPRSDASQMLFSTILSSYTPDWINNGEIKNNVWLTDNLYLAIRIKKADIYKFGWIRLYIDDYYDIKIKEFGFEK